METVTEDEVNMMIHMADRNNKGGVDLEDFVALMKQLGLIPDKDKKKDESGNEILEQEDPAKKIEGAPIGAHLEANLK